MYQRALVAIDLDNASAQQVLATAISAMGDDAELFVVHVVEPQTVHYSIDPTFTASMIQKFESSTVKAATNRMREICALHNIPEDKQIVVLGHPAGTIRELAKQHHCDVVFVGSHGRQGFSLLLGSTANAVLHGTPVDVWVCRLQPVKRKAA